MSNLVEHARRELALLGNGEEYDAKVIEMVQTFSEMGHSGSSAFYTIGVLGRLLSFENLMPLTTEPADWIEVGPELWQNRRNGKAFSTDGGATHYLLGDRETIITTQEHQS